MLRLILRWFVVINPQFIQSNTPSSNSSLARSQQHERTIKSHKNAGAIVVSKISDDSFILKIIRKKQLGFGRLHVEPLKSLGMYKRFPNSTSLELASQRLTENRLHHRRYRQHPLATEPIGRIAAQNAARRNTNQKTHFGHRFPALLVTHQIPFGEPRIAETIGLVVFPCIAFDPFAGAARTVSGETRSRFT